MTAAPPDVSLPTFLDALFDGAEGYLDLRALPGAAQTLCRLGDRASVTAFSTRHSQRNIYFGVAARRDATSGTLLNCASLGALFADLDFKRLPEQEARAGLTAFPLPPSIIVASGGGLHVYWLLREPLDLGTEAERARRLLRQLAHELGGDLGSAEPAHILRVPGTVNFKYDDGPREVTLEVFAADRRYNPAEFEWLLPEEAAGDGQGRSERFQLPEKIRDGERNATLYRLTRSLKARRMSGAAILAAVRQENAERCEPPLEESEIAELVAKAMTQADRPEFTQQQESKDGPSPEVEPLGVGLGEFLAREYPPAEPYVDGIFSSDGGGWIGGEEKLMKTYYALEEALCLARGLPVCGRFSVPTPRRVFFLEEEDPPPRTHHRLGALCRGHGLDPDDPILRAELDQWFRIEVWSGFTFEDTTMVARLDAAIAEFRPAVVYVDVLRKVTRRDLNKAQEASALLAVVDDLRRKYNVVFRLVHHYRKSQGFRVGRGSQEIGGSYVLGAWGESSLFFEPVGRREGTAKVEVQSKDASPTPGFRLTLYAEGPLVRLTAEQETPEEDADDMIRQAVATLEKTEAITGTAGVTITTLATALKRSEKTIRRAIKRLIPAGSVLVTGAASKGRTLYGVPD